MHHRAARSSESRNDPNAHSQESQSESPVLGQANGSYVERAVGPALQPHFLSAWVHQKLAGATGPTAVVPDAFADLIWINGKLLVSGPDHEVSFERVPPNTTVVGLRFQPGALARWLEVPASEIAGARIPLNCFPGNKEQEWIDYLGDAVEPAVVAGRLERCLAKVAAEIEPPDISSGMILEFMRSASPQGGPITHNLMSTFGVSERTLRRHCEQLFGYGPKTLDRVLRIQRFLALASIHPPNLAALASEAGFADQPHLNREARRLTGLSPTAILSQLRGSAHQAGNWQSSEESGRPRSRFGGFNIQHVNKSRPIANHCAAASPDQA